MSNPWDIPPKPTHAPDHPDELYAAVGKALSSWDSIEQTLAEIFSLFVGAPVLGTPLDEPAVRAYGSVVSFNSRAEMVDAASRGYFYKKRTSVAELEMKLRVLLAECRHFSGRRNDLAHGRVEFLIAQPYPWWSGNDGCWLFLPGILSTKRYSLDHEPLYIYTVKEITYFKACFEDLTNRLHDLWREILQVYASP